MLFYSLVAASCFGLALEVLASPLQPSDTSRKRDVLSTHAVHEYLTPRIAQQWAKRDKLPSTTILPIRIGLKQSNLDTGHDRLMEISTPGSAHFGKHMTSKELTEFFALAQSSVDAVIDSLVSCGITPSRISQSANKQWIQFNAAVDEAEDLFIADFYFWEHSSGAHKDIACEAYHVPARIQEHIDYVTPGIRMRGNGARKRDVKAKDTIWPGTGTSAGNTVRKLDIIGNGSSYPGVNSTSCSTYITADCIRVQYGVPNGTTAAAGNELGIFESLGDHYSTADLDTYLPTVYPYLHIPAGTYPENRLIDGAFGSSEDLVAATGVDGYFGAGGESTLDFQVSMPLIWPQKPVLFQTDDQYYEGGGSNGWLNTFLDAIDGSYCSYSAFGEKGDCIDEVCADPEYPDINAPSPIGYQGDLQCGVYRPTNVISISYGFAEDQLHKNYQYHQCNEYMKLGLQGVTVVLSSDDNGVGGLCIFGPADHNFPTIFRPSFPQNCPYVLTVGSTELRHRDPTALPVEWEILEEVASAMFASGGGFSNIWNVADYQRDSVQEYYDQVEATLPFSSYNQIIINGSFDSVTRADQVYHHGGRGYPDVAAVGQNQIILWNGQWWTIGGTSLSAPLWGSMLTLINEKRIAAGRSTLGFINPVLYAHPEAFTDITIGNNSACPSADGITKWGFPTAKVWDPVSGLGSPKFPILESILVQL